VLVPIFGGINMILLALLLLLDAALHAFLIYRFGTGDSANMPFLIYAVIDAILAIAVFAAVPYAVWATLVLSVIGLVGLTVTFNKPQRDKTLDRVIWGVDALVVAWAACLLFFV
jgi:hypothetical protein